MTDAQLLKFEDPDLYKKSTLDDRGRLSLGKKFANKRVRVLVKEIEE